MATPGHPRRLPTGNEKPMAASALNDLIDVAVPMPVYRTYTYRVPREFDGAVEIGMRVVC